MVFLMHFMSEVLIRKLFKDINKRQPTSWHKIIIWTGSLAHKTAIPKLPKEPIVHVYNFDFSVECFSTTSPFQGPQLCQRDVSNIYSFNVPHTYYKSSSKINTACHDSMIRNMVILAYMLVS